MQRFGEYWISVDENVVLHAKIMKPSTLPQRIVIIPPLVGAGAGQPFFSARDFSKRGATVVSFAYRGHPRSTGKFDLETALSDTASAIRWTLDEAKESSLPVHGFATCFGTIPLLFQFGIGGIGRYLDSLTTVSGLYQFDQILKLADFAAIVSQHFQARFDQAMLLEALVDGRLNYDSITFRVSLRDYLIGLMPELHIGLDRFEKLEYRRVHIPETIQQFAKSNYLNGVRIPEHVSHFAYIGRNDHLLDTTTLQGRARYKAIVQSFSPHAVVHDFDLNHYGFGPDRDLLLNTICNGFERAENISRRLDS